MKTSSFLLVLFLAAVTAPAATFIVTNTNDSGAGSLRNALTSAQTCAGGPHSIAFNVPAGSLTSGVAVITPASALPAITCSGTALEGTTQTTNVGNTNNVTLGSGGTVGTGPDGRSGTGDEKTLPQLNGPEVEIVGSNLSGAILTIQADSATVKGLSLHGGGDFSGVGTGSGNIDIQSGSGVVIEGNVIGASATSYTNPGGLAQTQNNLVRITGGSNVTIQKNLLGFARWRSVLIFNPSVDTVSIEQNEFVGSFDGIDYSSPGSGPTGTITVSGNLFHDFVDNGSGSTIFGIYVTQTGGSSDISDNTLQRLGAPIVLDVARPALIERNIISNNTFSGIALSVVSAMMPTTITRNSIFANGALGIDLGGDGVTANDPGDSDSGANGLQNFPIIQTVTTGPTTHITGKFRGAPLTTLDLDFYANGGCSNFPREFLEGETYLGSLQITTNGSGNASINVTFPVPTLTGQLISATATDPSGNTSEFSQRIILSMTGPASGPAAGGTPITVSGTDFADPTTMTIGGVAASGVTFVNDRTLTATSPGLSPGTSNDVVVTTPDGTTGTLDRGWVADFLDVPGGPFYSFVTRLVSNAITAGCGSGNYCPGDPVTRAQMSVFLLRSKNGLCYFPPAATGTVFADVPAGSFAAAYIEALSAAGVTAGCGGSNYCPTAAVTRAQMSVFLLRTLEGVAYVPPACVTPTFGDVPCSNGFARWIEELVRRGITAGCGGGNYCPAASVTRGQMAVFLVTTFGLP